MFDFLTEKFSSVFSRITGQSHLTEDNIADSLEKVREALFEADVPYDVVDAFVQEVKTEVMGQAVIKRVQPGQQFIKIVHDKLQQFLGGAHAVEWTFQIPSVICVMGLQGAGKTTSVAKLAHFVRQQAQKRNKTRRVLLASVDFYRPAAIDQLETLARQLGVDFYRSTKTDVVAAAADIHEKYRSGQYDHLFLDTAGRLHVDNQLLAELREIDALIAPKYKFLVLDAMTGQESLQVAKAFDQAVGFDAAVITKMDSETRGGAVFAFRYVLKKPIAFVGSGEKVADIALFHPDRMAGRILGMGDVHSLVEQAEQHIEKSKQDRMMDSLQKGQFTLQDFADQMGMVAKLGSIGTLARHLPGMGGKISDEMVQKGDRELKKFKAIIDSMNKKERNLPQILDKSRMARVARGAGVTQADVQELLGRFEQMQQYAKLFKKSGAFGKLFR